MRPINIVEDAGASGAVFHPLHGGIVVHRDAATAQQHTRRILPIQVMPPVARHSDGVGETVLNSPLDHLQANKDQNQQIQAS